MIKPLIERCREEAPGVDWKGDEHSAEAVLTPALGMRLARKLEPDTSPLSPPIVLEIGTHLPELIPRFSPVRAWGNISEAVVDVLGRLVQHFERVAEAARVRLRAFTHQPEHRPRTVIESPFAGDVETNLAYLRACLLDSYRRGESPTASHAIGPQVLSDQDQATRLIGMESGWAWLEVAEKCVAYTDLGITRGMRGGMERAQRYGLVPEERQLGDDWQVLATEAHTAWAWFVGHWPPYEAHRLALQVDTAPDIHDGPDGKPFVSQRITPKLRCSFRGVGCAGVIVSVRYALASDVEKVKRLAFTLAVDAAQLGWKGTPSGPHCPVCEAGP